MHHVVASMHHVVASMHVVSNLTNPVTTYLSKHKTEIKLLVLFAVARYVHKKTPKIKEKWQSTAPIRSIGRFAMNQYFSTPSSAELMQEQQAKYDNLYTKHYSRNATTIACKFSLNSIEALISNIFNPKMKIIRNRLQTLPKNGNTKEKKYALFKELFCIGVCRSICLIFMNTLYHILLHIVFAMFARRNLYKKQNKKQTHNNSENIMHLQYKNESEDKRKLFEIINIFHRNVTENYAEILCDKMNNILIKRNDYKLTRVFDTIDDLKSMLFEDIISASLDAYNLLHLRSMIDIQRVLTQKKYKTMTKEDDFSFCEMFFELNNITKCSDFNVLFTQCFRQYIQFWLNDLLNNDILKNMQTTDMKMLKKKLRYLNIMNCIIANFDALIKFKTDVENGKITQSNNANEAGPTYENTSGDILLWDTQKICEFVNQFNPLLANILCKLEITGAELANYDYYDVLHITQLHEYYLPMQLWQSIAFQLQLPCVVDTKFIKNKYKQRKTLRKRQENILQDIERLTRKTQLLQNGLCLDGIDDKYKELSLELVQRDIDDESDESDEDVLGDTIGNDVNEFDKFGILFEKWAKYMLRLNEFAALKEFLNIISGFDLVSSKADYFMNVGGEEDTFGMLSNMMDVMGDFDSDEKKNEMQQHGNPLFKAWENVQKFDLKNSVNNKWKSFTSYLNGEEDNADNVDEDIENGDRQNNNIRPNGNEKQSFRDKMKTTLTKNVSNLTSWWNK